MIQLDWVRVLEIISRHWIEQIGVLSVGVITWLYNKKVKRYMKDQKSIRLAMLAQLRDRFYQSYKQIVNQGYYPIRDREVMQDQYSQYHALGGNGVIDNLKRELDALPAYQRMEGEQVE